MAPVGWAKRSVPTSRAKVVRVGTARTARLCPPYDAERVPKRDAMAIRPELVAQAVLIGEISVLISAMTSLRQDLNLHGRHRPRKRTIQYAGADPWGTAGVPLADCEYWIARLRGQ